MQCNLFIDLQMLIPQVIISQNRTLKDRPVKLQFHFHSLPLHGCCSSVHLMAALSTYSSLQLNSWMSGILTQQLEKKVLISSQKWQQCSVLGQLTSCFGEYKGFYTLFWCFVILRFAFVCLLLFNLCCTVFICHIKILDWSRGWGVKILSVGFLGFNPIK